jgi:hypothetical protein
MSYLLPEIWVFSRRMGDAFRKAAADAGSAFAWEWGREASVNEIRSVLSLPTWRAPEIDRLLLFAADRELGFLRENPDLKGPLRLGFKGELEKVLAERERDESSPNETPSPFGQTDR